jgi:hypothetical protein
MGIFKPNQTVCSGGEDPVTGMVAPSFRDTVTEEPVAKPAL